MLSSTSKVGEVVTLGTSRGIVVPVLSGLAGPTPRPAAQPSACGSPGGDVAMGSLGRKSSNCGTAESGDIDKEDGTNSSEVPQACSPQHHNNTFTTSCSPQHLQYQQQRLQGHEQNRGSEATRPPAADHAAVLSLLSAGALDVPSLALRGPVSEGQNKAGGRTRTTVLNPLFSAGNDGPVPVPSRGQILSHPRLWAQMSAAPTSRSPLQGQGQAGRARSISWRGGLNHLGRECYQGERFI